MTARTRLKNLLELVSRSEEVSVDDACRILDVSPATARRDFQQLAAEGKVTRTWGGVRRVELPSPRDEISRTMPPYAQRGTRNSEAKYAIARAAARLVEDGDVLMVDGGTTTYFLAEFLATRPVRILTNSLPIAQEIDRRRDGGRGAEVHLTGGLLYPETSILVGPQSEAFLRRYHARWAFLSVGGMDEDGTTNHNEMVLGAERVMMAQSERVVILADSGKFGIRAMTRLCPYSEIHTLITEKREPRHPLLDVVEAAGVRLLEEP
jgi:DeoR/GlpR family transcriptional regulator of sugar metabolism